MTPVRHQREVENRMRDSVHQDRARIQLGKISRFGLLEMSRQRLRPSIGETSQGVCPRCNGTGHVRGVESLALSILRLMEEEAIKDNTLHVQAQVPVPVATYLLNEKRRSVMHVEKHHNVRVLIIPNPHMDTPQYEVLRVKNDETIVEASYELPVKKAELEEAKMPKFDKAAAKRDEPLIQGMSAPTRVAKPEETQVIAEKATVSKQTKPSGFFGWLKSLFVAEEVVEEVKETTTTQQAKKPQERRGNQQAKRRNNRSNSRNRNDRNADGANNRSTHKENETRDTRSNRDDEQNKPKRQPRKNTNNNIDKEKVVKEEKNTERRQRRNNRKKIRVAPTDKAKNRTETSVAVNTTENEKVNTPAEVVAQNDDKPRNRRSPRHLRANGQRRRRNNAENNSEATQQEQVLTAENMTADESVEARYPATVTPIIEDVVEQPKAATTPAEPTTVQEVKAVEVEATPVETKATETISDVVVNDTKALSETEAKEEVSAVDVVKQVTEVQQELPLEQEENIVVATEVSTEVKDAEVKDAEVTIAPEVTTAPKVTTPSTEAVAQEATNEVAPVVEDIKANDNAVNTEEDQVEAPVKRPAKKKVAPAVKKAAPKDKKLARQVKKANRLSGHAKAPMTKTETITIIKDIPTSFMADSERLAHQSSGRTAVIADVVNRSSAQATKP